MQRAVLNANCRPSSVAVVFPAPVPATALPIAIAVDDRWHPIHDWRWIGLIDIGTPRPIGTPWCIAGLVDYRRWGGRERAVKTTPLCVGPRLRGGGDGPHACPQVGWGANAGSPPLGRLRR